jgi:hypothetical protein
MGGHFLPPLIFLPAAAVPLSIAIPRISVGVTLNSVLNAELLPGTSIGDMKG